jgi:hypothetical protein
MNRTNLAVCFSPVIFNLNFDKKKMKYSKANTASNNIMSMNQHPSQPPASLTVNVPKGSSSTANTSTPSSLTTNDSVKLSKSNPNLFTNSSSPSPVNLDSIESASSSAENVNMESKSNNLTLNDSTNNEANYQTGIPISIVNKSNDLDNQTPYYSKSSTTPTINSTILSVESSIKSSKRKYSDRLNKAANTIVNFGAELSSNTSTVFFSSDQSYKESLENLEFMNKVVQLCVSDMIKYSIDLFTVYLLNFRLENK